IKKNSTQIKAAVVREKGGPFRIETLSLEGPRRDEVLVKVVATGLCHTDMVARDKGYPVPHPIVLGHEGAGIVESVGADVVKVAPGDSVVLTFLTYGRCKPCRLGRMAHCEKTFPLCSREPPWRFSRASKAIWLYNPRMASLRHRFEEPGDVQDIRLVVDTIPTLAWSAGPDGSAEFFNQRWLDYTGLSAKQALGSGWEVAIHPADLPKILDTFRDALNSVKPYEVEGRFRRFDGEFRWFLFRASPLCDESGKVVKWYGANTDIEDRKRAEDALRSHEQNLRLLVDTIPGHIVTTTPTGEIELLNRRVLEYFDKTPEELVNWRTSDAIHPDDLALTIAAWTRAIQTGEPYEREHRQRRADGAYRWFHTRGLALRDKEGHIVRWYLLPIDVDDRRRAEEALRKSEERWRSVFENSAIGVALSDLNGRFLSTNHVFQAMVGYTEEELRAVSFADLAHEDYRQANWALVTELVEGKRRQFQIEKEYRRKDGSSIWVSNNVSLVP